MSKKEQEKQLLSPKLAIPICAALPFNMAILRNSESGNCIAVTEEGECPHAKRRYHAPKKFKCDKNTLIPMDQPKIVTGLN